MVPYTHEPEDTYIPEILIPPNRKFLDEEPMEEEEEEPTKDDEEEPTKEGSEATVEEAISHILPLRIYKTRSIIYKKKTRSKRSTSELQSLLHDIVNLLGTGVRIL